MIFNELQIIGLETVYTALIIIPSLIIFSRIRKIYTFSNYKGLKYFSNAFLFISAGFFLRYIIMLNKILTGDLIGTIQRFDYLIILLGFFMILPGMFLLYSLIWKHFEEKKYSKKPINSNVFMIYLLAIILAISDFLLETFLFMYASQILLFSIATFISYNNYKQDKQQVKQFYFISMALFLIIMIINFISQYTIDSTPIMRIYTYIITTIVMFLFLHITHKLTKIKK